MEYKTQQRKQQNVVKKVYPEMIRVNDYLSSNNVRLSNVKEEGEPFR